MLYVYVIHFGCQVYDLVEAVDIVVGEIQVEIVSLVVNLLDIQ